MKHKKTTIIILIAVLFVIIMGVGIFKTFGLGFLSESKTYTGNGVSFEYPADYKITEVKGNSTFLVAKNTKNPNFTFKISISHINGSVYHRMSLDEYYDASINDFKSRGWIVLLVDNKTISVNNQTNDVQAYEIGYMEKMQPDSDSINGHILMFDKNGIRYTLDFQSKGKQTYDGWAMIKVTTSFKVLSNSNDSVNNITYSNGVVSFTYPENWKNITPEENTLFNRDWVTLFSVSEPSGDAIYLDKNENLKDYTTEQLVQSEIDAGGIKYLNNTLITVNGIQMRKTIKKSYGNLGEEIEYIDVYFQDKNKVMYQLTFVTVPKNFEKTNKVAEDIIKSIKLSN